MSTLTVPTGAKSLAELGRVRVSNVRFWTSNSEDWVSWTDGAGTKESRITALDGTEVQIFGDRYDAWKAAQ